MSLVDAEAMLRSEEVEPEMFPESIKAWPFLHHWYPNPPPLAATLNVAVAPTPTIWLVGCWVIAGGLNKEKRKAVPTPFVPPEAQAPKKSPSDACTKAAGIAPSTLTPFVGTVNE